MEVYKNQFKYLELRDGSVIIIKYIGTDNSVTVPAEINGKPVTEIDDDAFAGRENVKVSISSEVRFGKVSFAPNIAATNIQAARANVSQFETDSFPFKCYIEIRRYADNRATSVTIPEKINDSLVVSISDDAFNGYSSLTSINIPYRDIKYIGCEAFKGCSSLTTMNASYESINIPDSVQYIGKEAFADCSSITSISISNNVTEIARGTFSKCSSLTSINIPDSVKYIGDYAFYGCSSLESVNISNSVERIGHRAFFECRALKSINIQGNVYYIGKEAFRDCRSLRSIKIPSGTIVVDNAFENCPARIIRY